MWRRELSPELCGDLEGWAGWEGGSEGGETCVHVHFVV